MHLTKHPRESRAYNLRLGFMAAAVACACQGQVAYAQSSAYPSLARLTALLDTIPQGGWVQVSANNFQDAWPTGSTAVNGAEFNTYKDPQRIIHAWSSSAWDSTSGNLILWGGGHANYAGNEVYVWNGASGDWTRGSLPSSVTQVSPAVYTVPDNSAPMSSHTYDGNIYLPINNMFLTFGGAEFNTGTAMTWQSPSGSVNTGPWLWDPTKANANQVGGSTGSGFDSSTAGGNMWINRAGSITTVSGAAAGSATMSGAPAINNTAAYRTENGKDVVYVTLDSWQSGFPTLYKYTVGDVRNGGSDTWEMIGRSVNSVGFQGTGTIDTKRNLYIRTAKNLGSYTSELEAWNIDPSVTGVRNDIAINLVNEDGSAFAINGNFGMDYNSTDDLIFMWDGTDGGGTVYYITPNSSSTTWVVHKRTSATTAHPLGNFFSGALGKWDYIPELNAYIALDEYQTGDQSGVWLYKPDTTAGIALNTPPSGTPEPGSLSLLLAAVLGGAYLRRRQAGQA